jgi:hypothetical protein
MIAFPARSLDLFDINDKYFNLFKLIINSFLDPDHLNKNILFFKNYFKIKESNSNLLFNSFQVNINHSYL